MEKPTEQKPFNDETVYTDTMIEILTKVFVDKIQEFLECCIHTHNAKPINAVLDILNQNMF